MTATMCQMQLTESAVKISARATMVRQLLTVQQTTKKSAARVTVVLHLIIQISAQKIGARAIMAMEQ